MTPFQHDILPLARHLVIRKGAKLGTDDELFAPETAEALRQHTWPGNVRELANVVEHALILCDRPPILLEHLPRRLSERPAGPPATVDSPVTSTLGDRLKTYPAAAKPATTNLRQREIEAILDALDRHGGNKPKAAEELGISLKTLYNKLNQAGTLEKTA